MSPAVSMERAWNDLLACPACGGGLETLTEDGRPALGCDRCHASYPILDGIPSFVHATGTAQAEEIRLRDEEAASYDGLFQSWETFLEVPAIVRDLGPREGDLVLEVGAGTGRVTREYLRHVAFVVAVDFSMESLRHIRRSVALNPELLPKLVLVHADACALPVRDGTFDRTVSVGMLQHLPGEDHRRRAVTEMGRALRQGGRFVLQGRHWSRTHAWYEGRRESAIATKVARALIGNRSGGMGLERENRFADGTVSLYNVTEEELRGLVDAAGMDVTRVLGRLHTVQGMNRLGAARPLVETLLERTPLSLFVAQEIVAIAEKR